MYLMYYNIDTIILGTEIIRNDHFYNQQEDGFEYSKFHYINLHNDIR